MVGPFAKRDLSNIWVSKAHMGTDIFASNNLTQSTEPPRDLDMTDLYPNEDFTVAAPTASDGMASVQHATVSKTDTIGMRQDVQATQSHYLNRDTAFKGFITEVARATLGQERGDAIMGQVLPKSTSTFKQVAMAALDPTAGLGLGVGLGSIWAVRGELEKHADRIPNPEILAELDKVCAAAQAISNGQQEMRNSKNQPIKPPEGMHMQAIRSPEELMKLLERNVQADPVMQECERALNTIDAIERNQEYAIEHDAEYVSAAKIEASLAHDDRERLVELTGDKTVADAVERCTSYAVEMVREGLQMPPATNIGTAQFASTGFVASMVADALDGKNAAMAVNLEAELAQMNRQFDNPTMGTGRFG